MITKGTVDIAVRELCDSLDRIDDTLSTVADGTNWTVADSLSNIAFQLERIANALEKEK